MAVLIAAFLIYFIFSSRIQDQQSHQPAAGPQSEPNRLGPPDIYPNRVLTPGLANPEITQDNIQVTICGHYWSTKSVRPPAGYTNRLKIEQIQEYGDQDTDPRDYEEDHLIPLELGGDPWSPQNLWPEPYVASIPEGGARFKDHVENYLHERVCAGGISLPTAQQEIATDWYRVYLEDVRR